MLRVRTKVELEFVSETDSNSQKEVRRVLRILNQMLTAQNPDSLCPVLRILKKRGAP